MGPKGSRALRKHAHAIYRDFSSCTNCVIFLICAQNIDCGYSLEPPTSTHNLRFGAKIIPLRTPVLLYKCWGSNGYKLHGHVFMMISLSLHVLLASYDVHVCLSLDNLPVF